MTTIGLELGLCGRWNPPPSAALAGNPNRFFLFYYFPFLCLDEKVKKKRAQVIDLIPNLMNSINQLD